MTISTMQPSQIVEECDVLIIGSGAAGLSTAVTAAFHGLKVIVAEKSSLIGGTSAWSGGWMWIPMSPLALRAGIREEIDEPRRYLEGELGDRSADPRIEAFLQAGPEMVDFFERHTAVKFVLGETIPDFHATPGYREGGRSVCAAPFDGRLLGPWLRKLRPPLDWATVWGMGIASGADMAHFFKATRSVRSALHVAWRLAKHGRDLITLGRGAQLVNGNALIARLLRTALDLGVTILTCASASRLIVTNGAVTGAVLAGNRTIHAKSGVVLATGGFPHDSDRIARVFDHAPDGKGHYSAAPRTNTGDGIKMAEEIGGWFDENIAEAGAWAPVSLVPDGNNPPRHFPHLVERAKPGFIAVDETGRRFVNEADSYHDFMGALLRDGRYNSRPVAWLICDRRAQRRYGLGWAKPYPFPIMPMIRNGYLKQGRTIKELADACGLDSDQLQTTIVTFNEGAVRGIDPEFHRGESVYNRVQGDPDHKPNPALGSLTESPFYAVRIVPGSLGTFAGLHTDSDGSVLKRDGTSIRGLFAVGNDMSSIFGGSYPSGGITLGPAMTFGYLAGRVLAGKPATTDPRRKSC